MSLNPSNRSARIRRGPMQADVMKRSYTQIANKALRDSRLSRRARGLFAELTTHSDGFGISVSSLVEGGPEGRDAINSSLRELEEYGYLFRHTVQNEDTGRFMGMEYVVTDMPDGFTLTGDLDEEIASAGMVRVPMSSEETAGQSSCADNQATVHQATVHQSLVDQEAVDQALENRTHKKTTSKKTKPQKTSHQNTHGARAPGESSGTVLAGRSEVSAQLCARLIEKIKENGGRAPRATYVWRRAVDGLLDEDGVTVADIETMIDWAQADDFWASRCMDMAKIRKHFPTMAVQATRNRTNVKTAEGKATQKDLTHRRNVAMNAFMVRFEAAEGRQMTDAEYKQLLARTKEQIK